MNSGTCEKPARLSILVNKLTPYKLGEEKKDVKDAALLGRPGLPDWPDSSQMFPEPGDVFHRCWSCSGGLILQEGNRLDSSSNRDAQRSLGKHQLQFL